MEQNNLLKIEGTPLGNIITDEEFYFSTLTVTGINNNPAISQHGTGLLDEETCLFHRSIRTGDEYVNLLAHRIETGIRQRIPLPVVRFADGEYEFYDGSMKCNGLYRQAESTAAIRAAILGHLKSIRQLASQGIMAPLLFPGNVRRTKGFLSFFRKKPRTDMALRFLERLNREQISLNQQNYIPFYVVYAYLSSLEFAKAVDGKTVCVVNSDFNAAACADWFARTGSHPTIVHVPISASYVATQWDTMREQVFAAVPENPDCFMVGAGVGALQICVDAANRFSVPAVDSGHILNMMNDLESKSQGPRLYTHNR